MTGDPPVAFPDPGPSDDPASRRDPRAVGSVRPGLAVTLPVVTARPGRGDRDFPLQVRGVRPVRVPGGTSRPAGHATVVGGWVPPVSSAPPPEVEGATPVSSPVTSAADRPDAAHLRAAILRLGSRGALDLEGLGREAVTALLAAGRVRDIGDVFHLTPPSFDGLGVSAGRVAQIMRGLEAGRSRPLWRLLVGLSIPGVGESAARALVQALPSLDAIGSASAVGLAAVPGVSAANAAAVAAWFADANHRDIVARLVAGGVSVADALAASSDLLAGVTVVITGVLTAWSRDGAAEAVRIRGGQVVGAVSGRTSFVIAGAKPGAGKYDQARALGVLVLDEAGFAVLLEQGPDVARSRAAAFE